MRKAPWVYVLVCGSFLMNSFGLAWAVGDQLALPQPGTMVQLSPAFNPPVLKGLKVHPDNPLHFDFILTKGDSTAEISTLIKYFLTGLTVPDKDLWVNLSPYEKQRIIPDGFGQTQMGRELLAEDYVLKQISASLTYPESQLGKQFWTAVYKQAKQLGTDTNYSVNTFNKVWIVPDKAVVYENAKAGTAYVVQSTLKVMLEEDYLALKRNSGSARPPKGFASQIIRQIIIPQLTREVNQGKNFARLRQVYNSLILATWYKKKIKDSILAQAYTNQNKVNGLTSLRPAETPEAIYQRYLEAFKKGAYSLIKEQQDPFTRQTIPKKYFSGGADLAMTGLHLGAAAFQIEDAPVDLPLYENNGIKVSVDMAMSEESGLTGIFNHLHYNEEMQTLSYDSRQLRRLGEGGNNFIFLYPQMSLAVRVHKKKGENLQELVGRFNALADLDITPRVLNHGFIGGPNGYYAFITELIIGESLDKKQHLSQEDMECFIQLLSIMLERHIWLPDFKISQFMIGTNSHAGIKYGVEQAWLVDAERARLPMEKNAQGRNFSVVELAEYYYKAIKTTANGFGWQKFDTKRILEYLEKVHDTGEIYFGARQVLNRANEVDSIISALNVIDTPFIRTILKIRSDMNEAAAYQILQKEDLSLDSLKQSIVTVTDMISTLRRNNGRLPTSSQRVLLQEVRKFYAAVIVNKDKAMLENGRPTGGIDFKSDRLRVQTKSEGEEISFHLDPAQLKALQQASGLTPIITSVEPLPDVRAFLGING